MTDTLTREQRSEIMRRVKSKDSRPERIVRRLVHATGYRYRLHSSHVPGKPDLVFRAMMKVIFVHGCFWHRHSGCERSRMPKSRIRFWTRKFENNKKRDLTVRRELRRLGWKTLIVWECETSNEDRLRRKLRRFLES